MTNSADQDQLIQKPADLDLQFLQKQGISCFSRTKVKLYIYSQAWANTQPHRPEQRE